MKPWLKVLITVIVTAGIVGGGTYYFLNKKANTDKKNLQTQIDDLNKKVADTNTALTAAQTAKTTTDTAAAANAWKTYTNTKYGFTLSFTDKWTGYKVQEVAGTGSMLNSYRIIVPTTQKNYPTDPSGYVKPFVVGIYDKSVYDTAAAKASDQDEVPFGLDYGDKITENSKYVATLWTWQDSPQDLITSGLANEVNTVAHSLKFSN